MSNGVAVFLPAVQLTADCLKVKYCLPLVLSEGVSVNLLQVTLELVLQRVDQQDMIGLLIQQLGGPRHRRQEGHQAGHAGVVKVLHQEFGREKKYK